MIFGEFIYADGASELSGVMMFIYWLYAFTFMIVMFFTLLNFFLAIIVGLGGLVCNSYWDFQDMLQDMFLPDGFQSPFKALSKELRQF